VETMLADAWENAEEDLVTRRAMDLRGQLKNVRHAVAKHMDIARARMDKAALERLQDAYEDSEDVDDISDPNPLKGILDELEEAANPLAELLMNQVATETVRDRKVSDLIDE
jgi:hypothetical protein